MEPPFKCFTYLILTVILVSSYSSNCEQLSTVFVLETSDSSSDSSPLSLIIQGAESSSTHNNKSTPPENSNTRIITDDNNSNNGQSSSTGDNERPLNDEYTQVDSQADVANFSSAKAYAQKQQQQQQQSAPIRSTSGVSTATYDAQSQEPKQRESIDSARKFDDETPPAQTQGRLKIGSNPIRGNINQQPVTSSSNSQRTRSTTTTTTLSSYDNNQASGPPKTEERLLISITHDDDDYKPPQKLISSVSSLLNNDESSPHQQQQPTNQKRKPSITISIQDANINKQNGQSVIVRPSENGQHIVISTVGGSTLDTAHLSNLSNQNNKFNQNKPIPTSSQSNNNYEHPNREPNREPAEIPIQNNNNNNNHYQHTTSTTTYRPSTQVNNNNNNNDYHPITSTLVEQPRPPMQVGGGGERPQRPLAISSGGNNNNNNNDDLSSYESISQQQRPTPRPTSRPVNRPIGSAQQDGDTDETSIGQPNQQVLSAGGEPGASKYPLNERNCGLVHETKIVGGDEADPDDFLWMAAIVKSKPTNGEARPFCGGSLITRRHILTAAHCLESLAPRDVLVRLGSYDFDDNTASSLSADYAIDQFRVPAQYSKKTHVADIAIMRLKTPLAFTDNYKTVCMPQPRRSYVGALGTVTGYGSQSQTFRRATPKLRQVTVPIWENRKCSVVYKKNLTESFLCAGYEEGGKDACQGDSGGPIMTEGPNERMMVVGVVSHGIGCGAPGYPGVYTRTTTFLDWIEKNTRE